MQEGHRWTHHDYQARLLSTGIAIVQLNTNWMQRTFECGRTPEILYYIGPKNIRLFLSLQWSLVTITPHDVCVCVCVYVCLGVSGSECVVPVTVCVCVGPCRSTVRPCVGFVSQSFARQQSEIERKFTENLRNCRTGCPTTSCRLPVGYRKKKAKTGGMVKHGVEALVLRVTVFCCCRSVGCTSSA